MKKRYLRLKLRLLLVMVGRAVGVAAVCLLVGRLLQTTALGDLVWAGLAGMGSFFFGSTAAEVEDFFYVYVFPKGGGILLAVFALSLVWSVWRVMGRFTGWLDDVSTAVHRMASDSAEPVALPEVLSPVQEDLNEIRLLLLRRETEAAQSAQRARDLVVFLAHDLKTPLTSVIGYLTLLHDRPELSPEDRAKYTGVALEKARRLEELVGQFFDINRMELETIEHRRETLDLSMLLEQMCDEFWPACEEKDLCLRTAISPGVTVRGEGEQLARVFENVLRNAVNYSHPGGMVGLRAFRQGGEAVVTIRNEGLEIPEQELSHIFEKFYRLDAARSSKTGGAGLGLAIAKEIVERHGGRIRAESTGKWVVFTICLPALPEGTLPSTVLS